VGPGAACSEPLAAAEELRSLAPHLNERDHVRMTKSMLGVVVLLALVLGFVVVNLALAKF
jgi:hypothetical protein